MTLYETRLLVVKGVERLAYEIGRSDGKPVAVVGPNAVPCILAYCKQKPGDPCQTPLGQQTPAPHFARIVAMQTEVERLRKERDG